MDVYILILIQILIIDLFIICNLEGCIYVMILDLQTLDLYLDEILNFTDYCRQVQRLVADSTFSDTVMSDCQNCQS